MIDTHTHLYMIEEPPALSPGSGSPGDKPPAARMEPGIEGGDAADAPQARPYIGEDGAADGSEPRPYIGESRPYIGEPRPYIAGMGALGRALAGGVRRMVMPNVGVESMEALLALHHAAPAEATDVAVGVHPEEIDSDWRPRVEDVFARFEDERPVAVGEVGIDLYHDPTYRLQQMDAFGEQIERARQMRLPVIIHCREALDETLDVIRQFSPAERPGMLFHSFTADPEAARRILETVDGAMFGINGVVTFKNAPSLREAVAMIPTERLVLETDSPYLAPVPKRGKGNESAYLGYILEKVAEVKGISREEMERITDANAEGFFGTRRQTEGEGHG